MGNSHMNIEKKGSIYVSNYYQLWPCFLHYLFIFGHTSEVL